MIDFIGVGAQKAGTSWIYACLYEHPGICAPVKEIHFFSRDRYGEGIEWYEHYFRNCAEGKLKGEFSTSYLYSPNAAKRIASHYPDVKLIAVLRNPVDRAFSQYRNAIKAGEIGAETTFETYLQEAPSAIEQGKYHEQLLRYFEHFSKDQVKILIYEDSRRDPEGFIAWIYTFLGVDASFTPSMLHTEVNVARTPKHVLVERAMHRMAETLRKVGLDRLVWAIRKSGLPDLVRKGNTKQNESTPEVSDTARRYIATAVKDDVRSLSELVGRDLMHEWHTHV